MNFPLFLVEGPLSPHMINIISLLLERNCSEKLHFVYYNET